MKKEDVHINDLERILIGNAPWEFLIEVLIRTLIVYFIFLFVLRLLGKRFSAQLSIVELTIMISLGAIIALPFSDPTRGILPGIILVSCVLLYVRLLNYITARNEKAEHEVLGDVKMLIKDGILDLDELKLNGFTRNQLFEQLRSKNITHLGEIKRAYLEACGLISVFKTKKIKPGLSLYPQMSKKLLDNQPFDAEFQACGSCGTTISANNNKKINCPNCGALNWTKAMVSS